MVEHIKIPSTVRALPKSAFSECYNLKTVELQEGLEEIGAGCFYDSRIKEIVIPSSVKSVEEKAFG